MPKLVLQDITNIFSAAATLNSNNDLIEAALENTLSRDGTTPNEMNSDLDMNANRIYNLPEPSTNTEPARLQDIENIINDLPDTFKGDPGPPGPAGADGVGIPVGGATGQVLLKASATDYDVEWSSSGSPSEPTFDPGWTGGAPRTIQARLRDSVHLADSPDFDPTGTDDQSGIIMDALAAIPARGGRLILPPGILRVESTLTVQRHNIEIEGEGGPGMGDWDNSGATELHWYGPIDHDVLRVGNVDGEHVTGFAMRDLQIDGRGNALTNLRFTDAQRMMVDRVFLREAKLTSLLFDNGTAPAHPTGWGQFRDLMIYQIAAGANGHGIMFNGVSPTGVSMLDFIGFRCRHHNGDGIRFVQGDGYTFLRPYIFGTGAGQSIHYPDWISNEAAVAGLWIHPVVSHMYVGPDFSQGRTTITVIDWPIGDGQPEPWGPGARSINCLAADGRRLQGRARQKWNYSDVVDDSFAFMTTIGDVLFNHNGTWAINRSGGATISNANQPGGAISMDTGASGNISIYATPTGGGGYARVKNIDDFFVAAPTSLADVTYRIGLFEDNGVPPVGGAYFYYDQAFSGNWQAVCVAGGTSTIVDTGVSAIIDKKEFRISTFSDKVRFYIRSNNTQNWTKVTDITTNLPGTALAPGFQVVAKTAASKALFVYHRHTTVDVE